MIRARHCFSLVAIIVLCPIVANAGTTSWSYSNHDHGSYVPRVGSFTEFITGDDQYSCRTSFTFDSTNVASIADYNNGGNNPDTDCDNHAAFLTLDMSAEPDSWDLEIDADTVTSNLPNPKYDIEDNNWFGENDESEVVALGAVTAKSYYMRTYWNDYRDGDTGDGGDIQSQFAMSIAGSSDYNNCFQSDVNQIINPYGNDEGDL